MLSNKANFWISEIFLTNVEKGIVGGVFIVSFSLSAFYFVLVRLALLGSLCLPRDLF